MKVYVLMVKMDRNSTTPDFTQVFVTKEKAERHAQLATLSSGAHTEIVDSTLFGA